MIKFLVAGLTILFIGLKLTNYIDWSWWWTLSPLWIYIVWFLFWLVIYILTHQTPGSDADSSRDWNRRR